MNAQAAEIEIVETRRATPQIMDGRDPGVIIPNEIRINGRPVLAPKDHPVVVHQTDIDGMSPVMVTLTVFARRVVIDTELEVDGELVEQPELHGGQAGGDE